MTPTPFCIIYSQDAELVRRAKAYLRAMSEVRHVSEADRLYPVLQQTGPCVLIMDLRSKECRDLIEQIQREQSEVLIIALGVAQSETLREAEQLGVYAAEEVGLGRVDAARVDDAHRFKAFETLAQVLRDQVFYVFAHGSSPLSVVDCHP